MKHRARTRCTAAVLTLCLLLSLFSIVSAVSVDYTRHWAAGEIAAALERGYVQTDADGSYRPNEAVTWQDFCDMLNTAAQYTAVEESIVNADAPITRGEAAQLLSQYLRVKLDHTDSAGAVFKDLAAESPYANAIGACADYGIFNGVPGGSFEADRSLTRGEAAVVVCRAVQAVLTVSVGTDVLVRETVPLTMEAVAVAAGDDILVHRSIISLMGGAEVPEELRTVEANPGELVVHFSQKQAVLPVDESGRISLRALVEAYGGSLELEKDGNATVGATFRIDRALLKSNRDLTDRELALSYSKYYLRYLHTPLPERPDEIAWNEKKDTLFSLETKKDDDTILNPNTYSKLLDPDFVPEEGWSTSSDGTFTTMCTIVDMNFPEGTEIENADILSWWFAWHTVEDLRYMMWNPSCHYGIWVTTGNYDTRTQEQIEEQPMRIFDTTLGSWYERAYGSANRAHEDTTLNSYTGTAAYLDYDGTNSLEYENLIINFVDLTDPGLVNGQGVATPYFSSQEEYKASGHSIAEEFRIQAGVTGESSTLSGVGVPMASMLHVVRQIDGEWKIITHFNAGPKEGSKYVSEHQVREMAILADFLPELYAEEKDHDLEAYADPHCYLVPTE